MSCVVFGVCRNHQRYASGAERDNYQECHIDLSASASWADCRLRFRRSDDGLLLYFDRWHGRRLPDPADKRDSQSINYGSGALPAGIYYVETTFYNGSQETLTLPRIARAADRRRHADYSPRNQLSTECHRHARLYRHRSGGEMLQGQTSSSTAQFNSGGALLRPGAVTPSSNTSVCSIAFNDTIIPYSGYNVSLISSTGNAYPGWPQAWQLNGGLNGTVNISNGAPLWNGVIVYPQPIVAQPLNHGPQSISGSLGLSGYNLFNVGAIGFGTSTPGWPVDVENGAINASGGFLYNGAAPVNHILLGNGTAYVDSATSRQRDHGPSLPDTSYAAGTLQPQGARRSISGAFTLGDNPGNSDRGQPAQYRRHGWSYTNPSITVDALGPGDRREQRQLSSRRQEA